METKFNFKSQPATSIEQSERLLALGLNKETADMIYERNVQYPYDYDLPRSIYEGEEFITRVKCDDIPAWSLHRLIEMMPDIIKDHIDEMLYHLSIDGNSVFYENRSSDLCQFFGDNLYVCIIDCIEWLIKEEHFNEEYLV